MCYVYGTKISYPIINIILNINKTQESHSSLALLLMYKVGQHNLVLLKRHKTQGMNQMFKIFFSVGTFLKFFALFRKSNRVGDALPSHFPYTE